MCKNSFNPVVATFGILALSAGLAFGQSQTNETVRVLEVKASDSVKKQVEADNKTPKLAKVLESLENNINEGIDNTHKFTTLSRDLKSVLEAQSLPGDDGQIEGGKYYLNTTVTEFSYDRTDTPIDGNGIQVAAQCTVHLSGKAEFTTRKTGVKISANFEVSTNDRVAMNPNNLRVKNMGDDLLKAAAHEAANQIVSKVVSK